MRHTRRRRGLGWWRLLMLTGSMCIATAVTAQISTRTLDRFDDVSAWKAVASDGVTASVAPVTDAKRQALRLTFDLGGTAGYAIARRALPLELPDNYAITFWLRADAPVNDLQLKLVDATGDNVWWYHRPNFAFTRDWQRVTIKKRQIAFAWGPTKDRVLRQSATIEIVVAAGRDGGHGTLYVSDLELQELPPPPDVWPQPTVRASSAQRDADAVHAVDGVVKTAWRSNPKAGREQWLMLDFGRPREFGGLVVQWVRGEHASAYDVQYSDDGRRWRTVRRVTEGGAGRAPLLLTESDTRYLRLAFHDGPKRAYAIAEITVEGLAYGATPNAFFSALARDAPRGEYPRGFTEQAMWTLVGVDGGRDSGLLSEDGALEVGRGGFTIEPVVVERGRVTRWSDVDSKPFLVDDDLPMPGVLWTTPRWSLRVTAFASGTREDTRLVGRYDVTNLTDQPLALTLVLAVRPFQANPATQTLSTVGGVSTIHELAWKAGALAVNGTRRVHPLAAPARVFMQPFDAGSFGRVLVTPDPKPRREVNDDFGYASAAFHYPLTLAARSTTTVGIVAPLAADTSFSGPSGLSPVQWLAREQASVAAAWRSKLDRVTLRVPPEAQPLVDTLRTALAHILMTRDGAILRPGTRSYARSWIRDGAMIGESLLRLGHAAVAADYWRWYATRQFDDGKVPCCIDARGPDPVPEHDSAGEFLFLAGEIYRYTQDRNFLGEAWPRIDTAARYLETLRQSGRSDGGRDRPRSATFGLVPPSISHEGYSAKPVHSYWDDFWALKGYASASMVAETLGDAKAAKRLGSAHDEFRRDLHASLTAAAASHRIDYLPGSVELGDFDPTSTTIALAPRGDPLAVPDELLTPTFERYWEAFTARRDGKAAWNEYTPYELRTVGTFVRLGFRDRAHELLDFFMDGRRPAAWNQWPEVVGRELRKPLFVGDAPHAWVASDYIRALLDLFAYERSDGAMMLAAGIPAPWLDRAGVAIRGLNTPYGTVSYSLVRTGQRIAELTLSASGRVPPGGFVLAGPWQRPLHATINGRPVIIGNELRIDELEAKVVLQLGR